MNIFSKDGNVCKRQKTSDNESTTSQDSQDSPTTLMPEEPWIPSKKSDLMKVYNTHAVADNLEDPSAITRLRLRDEDSFYDDWEYGDFNFHEFQTFALLPKLTHITLNNIGGGFINDGGSYHSMPTYASNVTHITMKRCEVSDDVLVKMIGFSRDCLEAFTYRTGGLKSPDSSRSNFSPGPVWVALGRSSSTLKKLDIDFDEQIPGGRCWNEDDEDYEEDEDELDAITRGTIKSLSGTLPEFPRLTSLRIGMKALLGLMILKGSDKKLVDVLPDGLEELDIRGYDATSPRTKPAWKSQIDELVQQMAEKLPSLKHVRGIDELIPNGRDVDCFRNGDLKYRHPTGNIETGDSSDSD